MQRSLFLLPVVLILSATILWAAPTLVVEKKSHDFGQIKQGETFDYVYRFHNAGDRALEIGQLRVSCGCTAAFLSARRLSPGMVGELRVSFDSKGFRGPISKVVSFETNDPNQPTVSFELKGEVKVDLLVNPERVSWGRVTAESELRQLLEVVNDSDRTIRLERPLTTVPNISASLSKQVLNAGEKATLEVLAEFPTGKKRLAGYVILRSDFPAVPELKVPVSARLSTN